MDKELKKIHASILSNLMSFILKQDDAPCSAEAHLYSALIEVLKLNPGYYTDDPEKLAILNDVREYEELTTYQLGTQR